MKKPVIVIVLLALCGGAAYFFTRSHGGALVENAPITLYGNVDIRDVALGFRVSGRIEALHFEEGDTVQKGTVLATLDPIPFQEELALRQAALAEAQAIVQNAEKLFTRRESLVGSGAVSRGAYDDALAGRDEARAKVETAKASLAQAQTSLHDATLVSPSDGIILTRVRELGSIVAAGATVYSLALDNPVWVRAYIDEPNLGRVYPGQKATVKTDSGGSYAGQMGFISPQAEFTPKNVETRQLRTDLVYRLRIIVDTPDKGLRQGMPVTVILAE